MHYLKSSLNIDEIIKNFNNDSYVIIKNYFTEEEINLAKDHDYKPISFGSSRLRTETAGIVAAHSVNLYF